jgi:hypothetical protein
VAFQAGGQEHRCLNEVAPGRPVRRLSDRPLTLARCFDAAHAKPAGWDVRSVAIAGDSPDGKAAVQAGLREFAPTGYYRIERGRCCTAA